MWSRWLMVVLVLLGINLLVVSELPSAAKPVHIPYSPDFLTRSRPANAKAISSRGSTVDGEFRTALRDESGSANPAKRFSTEVPTFADTKSLATLLRAKHVVVNAEPPAEGRSLLETLLLGLLPTLLLIGWSCSSSGGRPAAGSAVRPLARPP